LADQMMPAMYSIISWLDRQGLYRKYRNLIRRSDAAIIPFKPTRRWLGKNTAVLCTRQKQRLLDPIVLSLSVLVPIRRWSVQFTAVLCTVQDRSESFWIQYACHFLSWFQ